MDIEDSKDTTQEAVDSFVKDKETPWDPKRNSLMSTGRDSPRLENIRSTARDSWAESLESKRDSLKDTLKDTKRDSLIWSGRDSPRSESKRASLKDSKRESLKQSGRDSPRPESIKDSFKEVLKDPKRDSLKGSGRDSPRPESKRDSLKDINRRNDSFKGSGRETPRQGSLKRDGRNQRSLKRNESFKTASERKRSSGRSLDKNLVKKLENAEDEKKSEGDMETASVKAKRKALLMERRMLCGCTALVGLASLVWLTAICTESWFTVHANSPHGVYINSTSRHFLYSTSGLFKICRYARRNATMPVQQICQFHEMFPSEEKLKAAVWVDKTIISKLNNYTRTEMFFSILSFILMVKGFLFSIYTFRNPRYMFKRLAAGIHFLSCATVMVVIEVLINSIEYERLTLNVVHPKEAHHTYGYSFYLGWSVFILNSIASISFLAYSKKRKGDKAPTEEMAMADEPTIIGR